MDICNQETNKGNENRFPKGITNRDDILVSGNNGKGIEEDCKYKRKHGKRKNTSIRSRNGTQRRTLKLRSRQRYENVAGSLKPSYNGSGLRRNGL